MNFVAPSPASTSLHQVSTDSIVVVCSSLVVCLLQPSVPPIAILGVPTFELVCMHFIWANVHSCVVVVFDT